MTDRTPREVRTDCYCPGSPHPDGDLFVLPADLPMEAGHAAAIAATNAVAGDAEPAIVGAILRNKGISEWNLVDAEGRPMPLTGKNVAARVTWEKGGAALINAVYAQYVTAQVPLASENSTKETDDSSPNGQMESLTSPKTPSSRKRRTSSGSS
jgi:hypothetical protein